MSPNSEEPAWIEAEAAAAMLGIRRASLYAYVSRGQVRSTADPADPRRRLYAAEDLRRLAAAKRQGRSPRAGAERALDWGLPVLETALTRIEDGRLFYRDRDAVAWAAEGSLEATARLLWGLPGGDPFALPEAEAEMPQGWRKTAERLRQAHPADRAPALLALLLPGQTATPEAPERLAAAAARLLRALAAALLAVERVSGPLHRVLAEHWAAPKAAAAIRRALVLCADHELNASAFAVRVVASTGASPAAALLAGLAALSGPRHGGATERAVALLEEAERLGEPERAVTERLRRGDPLPGFGHPLYPEGDPRAAALLAEIPAKAFVRRLAAAAEAAAGRPPSLDYALAALQRHHGLPAGAGFTLFAGGRGAGWIAHALEQYADGRLIRPRARWRPPPPLLPPGQRPGES